MDDQQVGAPLGGLAGDLGRRVDREQHLATPAPSGSPYTRPTASQSSAVAGGYQPWSRSTTSLSVGMRTGECCPDPPHLGSTHVRREDQRHLRPARGHEELEKRFSNRAHTVDGTPGFLGFQLLRPVKGEERYFVVTQWADEESFQAWRDGPAIEAHAGQRAKPVGTGADLLEFEVVMDVKPTS